MKKLRWIMMGVIVLCVMQGAMAQGSSSSVEEAIMLSSSDINGVHQGSDQISLSDLLSTLEEHFDVTFLYKDEVMVNKYVQRDKIKIGEQTGRELARILDQLSIVFQQIDEQTYVLLNKDQSLQAARVQEKISGTVTDGQSGETLPGVNVMVKGTTTGTSTDSEGSFELTVESLQDTLIFSFVGYQTREVPINGRTDIDVALQSQAVAGDEVVVTAFGLEREVKSLTYSTQEVSSESLTKARESNVASSLAGRIAGLNITNTSGGPGAPAKVNLRGNRSFTGNSEPLYVLDGVPIRGNPQDLNPDDIENINVLKGGNAAALYGSAAQNGVIVITTNRAEKGQVDISLSSNFTMDIPNILTDYQNEYGQGTDGEYEPSSEFSFGPKMEGQQVPFWSPDPNHQLAGTTVALTPQPNNVRDVFQRGYNLANNLTVNIGGERTQTAFSYTYTDAEGIVPTNTMQRNNLTIRVNSELIKGLNLDSRLSYSRSARTNPPISVNGTYDEYANPIRGAYRMPRSIQTEHFRDFEYTDEDGNLRQNYFNPGSNGGFNPYWAIYRNTTDLTKERVIAMTSLKYDFSESLSLMVRGAYDGSNLGEKVRWHNDTYIIADNGAYEVTNSDGRELNADFLLSYTQDFAQNWSFDGNFGGSIKQSRNSSVNTNTGDQGLTVPNLFTLGNTQSVEVNESIGSPIDVQSLYASGEIGWKNLIFLDVTARNDWSSTLPPQSRSYFYPSAGLSAILSDLVSLPGFISYAKVRASYAEVGSSAPAFALSRSANVRPGGTDGFLSISGSIPAEDLRPERTESIELGADFRFFDGRLGLDFTHYQTTTVDQLFSVALPIGSGASSYFTNGGDIENKGIEVSLTGQPIQSRDFNWDITLNWNRNRNTVAKISDELDRLQIGSDFLREVYLVEGRPYGETTSRGYARDDQGRVIVESNGIPRFTPSKSDVVVSNFEPDWMGSVLSTISYKNITASFLIDHRQGGSIVSMSNALMFADGVTKQTLQGRNGGLIFGENFMADEKAVMVDENGEPTNNQNTYETDAESFWRAVGGRNAPVGEVFVVEATNTRLRELTLGYNFSESMLSSIGLPFSNINLSVVGRNLFFIYRASENIDPDLMVGTSSSAPGWELLSPPTTRRFGANIKIDF